MEKAPDLGIIRAPEEQLGGEGRAALCDVTLGRGEDGVEEPPAGGHRLDKLPLADLLAAHLHPAIPHARADEMAELVLTSAEVLRAAVAEAEVKVTSAALLSRTRGALAVAAAVQLGRLKRLWLASGRSEAEIHAIIPDRPRPKKAVVEAPAT